MCSIMAMYKEKVVEGRRVLTWYDREHKETYLYPTNVRCKFNMGQAYAKWMDKLNTKYGYAQGHELSVWIEGVV